MQIKKLQWINAPAKARIVNSRTFSFLSETEHRLVNTFEEGSFSCMTTTEGDVEDALEILISQQSFVRVTRHEDGSCVHFALSSIETRSYYPTPYRGIWKVVKTASLVEIYLEDTRIFSFAAPTTQGAISVCILTRGKGQINCVMNS